MNFAIFVSNNLNLQIIKIFAQFANFNMTKLKLYEYHFILYYLFNIQNIFF